MEKTLKVLTLVLGMVAIMYFGYPVMEHLDKLRTENRNAQKEESCSLRVDQFIAEEFESNMLLKHLPTGEYVLTHNAVQIPVREQLVKGIKLEIGGSAVVKVISTPILITDDGLVYNGIIIDSVRR